MLPSASSGDWRPDQEVLWHFLIGMVCIRGKDSKLHVVNVRDRVLDKTTAIWPLAIAQLGRPVSYGPVQLICYMWDYVDAMQTEKIDHETAVTSLIEKHSENVVVTLRTDGQGASEQFHGSSCTAYLVVEY
jgi:hypothetical protein